MSMKKLLNEGWVACPDCGTRIDEFDESAPDWSWRIACPDCEVKIAGRIT